VSKSATLVNVSGWAALTPKEKALQKSRQKKPAGNADQYSDERESQSVADHRSEYLCKISAKRDADAEFARALANGVGHDTVNSKTTEQQGPQSEQCQQRGTMGAATETPITSSMVRIFDTGWSLSCARISSRTGRESERSGRGANRESHRARNGCLEVRCVDFLNRGVIQSQVACVSHDTDDLAGKAADSHFQAPTDGALLGKHVARYNVVDDEDVGGSSRYRRCQSSVGEISVVRKEMAGTYRSTEDSGERVPSGGRWLDVLRVEREEAD
jgi:hypothetical protein